MRRMRIDWVAAGLGLAIILLVAAVQLWSQATRIGPVRALDEQVYDQFQRWSPRPFDAALSPVRIIDIDEASLAEFGQWPWPRIFVAELVNRLSEAGAAAIAFDILFSEPDRTSPRLIEEAYARLARPSPLVSDAAGIRDHDTELGAAMARAPVVLAAVLGAFEGGAPPAVKTQPSVLGPDPSGALTAFRHAMPVLAPLEAAATGIGSISLSPTEGETIRRVPVFSRAGDVTVPLLAVEAIRVALGAGYQVKTTGASGMTEFSDQVGVVSMRIPPLVVPLELDGTLRVRYSGAERERVIAVSDILAPGGIAPEIKAELEGRILLVGASATALFDQVATPLSARIPGVHVHAEVIEQIFSGEFLTEPDWGPGAALLALVLGGLLIVAMLSFNLPLLGLTFLIVLLAGAAAGSWWLFSEQALLVSPVAPMLGVAMPHLGVSAWKYFSADASRREITRQFEHFVAPEVIADIIDDPDRHLNPGGEKRDLSILFLDVRRFSTLTEKMQPDEVILFINKLLTPLSDVIIEHEGTIDKYMGDAIMAFWNAPRLTKYHETKAVRAMLAFEEAVAKVNADFAEIGLPDVAIGVGINTGPCAVGNMGSTRRLAYSCVGDSVNLAARLEGQTKAYGVKNLIGSRTAMPLVGFAAIEIDSVAVKGRTQPETIYTVAGDEEIAALPEYEHIVSLIAGGRTAYLEQNWDAAEAVFRTIAEQPQIGVFEPAPFAEIYLERIAGYRIDPPPADWDGVFVATSK